MLITKEVEIGGKILSIETGRFAKQANGSVMVRYNDTMVLVTAVAAPEAKDEQDFFPLQVEYREKASAAGKFPGGFIKREGRPSEKEILSARLIDRPIRPLFPETFKNETQVVATVYSSDGEHDSDVLGAVGASAALCISDIPFNGPVGEVRVVKCKGEYIVYPTFEQVEEAEIELVVAGTEDSIMMVEGEAKEVSEEEMITALRFAHDAIKKIVALQRELVAEVGKAKREINVVPVAEELVAAVRASAYQPLKELFSTVLPKQERHNGIKAVTEATLTALAEQFPESEKKIKNLIHDFETEIIRSRIIEDGIRLDGRDTRSVRPITIELGVLPRTHASALFTRGETQSLTTLTLGTKDDEQIIDGLHTEVSKRFILHYNFPPFSVGEVGRMTGVGRREIGHGNLAERSLKVFAPKAEEFPYTIRLISDVLESNGSSSMATVCAGSLALMDGGVPVPKHVAGIAMGLIKEGDKYAVLTDILGDEDHFGDMDFKVAGTVDGITGFQMDIKIEGISFEIMEKAVAQAKEGRLHILSIMNAAISSPRVEISKFAPRFIVLKIPTDMIGMLIGPGGKHIQGLQRDYEVDIHVEDDGTVSIASILSENAEACARYIKGMMAVPEVGETYDGHIVKILEFGAVIEFLPGKTGLLHVSEIDHKRIKNVTDVLSEGEKVTTKLIGIDGNKFKLSRKALLPKPAPTEQPQQDA